ncbi:hypothetical protein [Microbacterium sp. AK031]|uniref:hypothetical protein n=1 Tax=Microbacterium sp. AK031 TaxID=2723076 RepID=UPI002166E48D|nr:hypothetical protein [Microbacterium sp. AK031]MCS3844529.1 hypothetical protein [Microbacterium sp. AK031]
MHDGISLLRRSGAEEWLPAQRPGETSPVSYAITTSAARSRAESLPSEYGVDELTLIVQDKEFDRGGRLVLSDDGSEPGMLGDTVMVNGQRHGRRVPGGDDRTRASATAERFDREDVHGRDGSGAPRSGRAGRGRRRVRAGRDRAVAKTDLGGIVVPATSGGNDEFDVLEFRAADSLTPSPEPSWPEAQDAVADKLHEDEASVTREFVLNTREPEPDVPTAGALRGLGRSDHAVHVPLPHVAA